MKKYKSCFLILLFLISFINNLFAQNNIYFSPLSANNYTTTIAALKLRKPPLIYTDKKEQKTYADIIKDRDESIIYDFENNKLIADSVLLNKCNSIIKKLKAANNSYNFDSVNFYINRSCIANACCFGEGTIYINLGLFLWIDNDDEFALILAHELSHQFLQHSQNKIKKNIALLSSYEFKNEIKAILKSQDGRYLRYKNLMKDITAQTSTHSRYKESEADSLGVVLCKNAGYNIKNAASIILKLDNVEDIFNEGNFYSVKNLFQKSVTDSFLFEVNKKYNGLSMANITMNADEAFDSLKTHPDCKIRYAAISKNIDTNASPICCKIIDAPFKNIKERAMVEIIRYQYEIGNLTLCTHLCIIAMQNGFNSSFYNYYISLCFIKMYEADKQLNRFYVTNAKAKAGSSLKDLQDFIFSTNSDNLKTIAEYFLNNNTVDKNVDDYTFAKLMYNTTIKNSSTAETEKTKYLSQYPLSKYNYLITSTNKKD